MGGGEGQDQEPCQIRGFYIISRWRGGILYPWVVGAVCELKLIEVLYELVEDEIREQTYIVVNVIAEFSSPRFADFILHKL